MFLTPLISAPVDITIMLLVAFAIGYVIAHLLGKQRIKNLRVEMIKIQQEIRDLSLSNESLDLAKDKIQNQLNECIESKSSLVNSEEMQQVTLELRQERERGETARRSLAEIERAHEGLKQELQLKIDQMLSQEEANKLRSEINRLRVFNTNLEEELLKLREAKGSEEEEDVLFGTTSNDQAYNVATEPEFVKSIGVKQATAEEKDDLKKISGVGPFIEAKLNKLGIYTFQQIASLTDHQAEKINEAIEFFPGRIQRDDWVAQARRFTE